MFRRISTKWVSTVLAAVVVPFLGFAWYIDGKVKERQLDVVRYYLLSIAGDMADRLDNEIRERENDIETWATLPITEWTVGDYGGDELDFTATLESGFDRFVEQSGVYDLVVAVDAEGRMAASSTLTSAGAPLADDVLARLADHDYSIEPWFQGALEGHMALVDHHASNLLPPVELSSEPHPENYHIGIAFPVYSQLSPNRVVGVVYGLVNWSHFQFKILRPIRPRLPDLHAPDLYASCYAWLWMSDANTIIGHPTAELYTTLVSEEPVALPELTAAARSSDWGMYPEYRFRGVLKTAAYKHCSGLDRGGFGWVVGVGIDNEDIYATIDEMSQVLKTATVVVLGIVVVGTVVIARRTTRPISELQQHTVRIAAGDLESRVQVNSKDELGDLGRAFNRMTSELAESRGRLIKAEKDAAWREMARQVAHEIKNPLTPISLSTTLLRRARDEKSPEFHRIFDRTMDLIERQIVHMRSIAADFAAFAGVRKPTPEPVRVRALCDEVLALNAAWAQELGVVVRPVDGDGVVFVDPRELRRVLINLVSNAFEAMPSGGELAVRIARVERAGRAVVSIDIEDDGVGLSEEARARLFEPYFTTRTHGTGLGLAISFRLVDEMGGEIELASREPERGRGTVARIVLPEHRA